MRKSPYQKAKAVEKLFSRLDADIQKFYSKSSMRCLVGCGKCCTKPNIDATVLEFLPLAMHYYMRGQAEQKLEDLQVKDSLCHNFSLTSEEVGSGFCQNYNYRGLICRLFGASAAEAKGNKLKIYTCNIIKESQPEAFQKTTAEINEENFAPVVSHYYRQLANIDPDLARNYYPINEATKKALEFILHYYAYRKPPKGFKKAA
ncbi:YkgJ family cysteine cluster protein [Owenweeksia hongkongensis]|uniref:YkgJ family cysteine cluster protein n=1 Tax=Owenweeksia hongkongensis TaxID=253245 RepID=UPI003A948790